MILRPSFSPLASAAAFCLRAGRPVPISIASLPARNAFHTTRPLQYATEATPNHYETLNLRPDASLKDIKKSFYALSKTHHPDTNPTDPSAPERFMLISEAYTVLSHPDRRAAYDRTLPHRTPHRHGSYSSTSSPAGGRPASGLSRRRSSFTGPPPSFYRSGGWGAHSAKRGDAHRETTGNAGSPDGQTESTGGMGPGQDPYAHSTGSRAAREDVPHFDQKQHEHTHRTVTDEVRAARKKRMEEMFGEREGRMVSEKGMFGSFVLVCGMLVIGVIGPIMIWQSITSQGKAPKTGDGKKSATAR